MKPPKQSRVGELSVQWCQESDSCAENNLGNGIIVTITDAGGGPYLVLKTDRWAIDDDADIDDFCRALKEVLAEAQAAAKAILEALEERG